jgi:hypothetical protein
VAKARLDLPRDVGFDMRENPELLTAHIAHRSFVVALPTCIELCCLTACTEYPGWHGGGMQITCPHYGVCWGTACAHVLV